MTDATYSLSSLDVDELATRCREMSTRAQPIALDPCHELFRRAIAHDDQQAWAALYTQYKALALHTGRASHLDPLEQDSLVNETFARFSNWVRTPAFTRAFPPMAVLIATLKKCARSTAIDHHRRWEHQQRVAAEATLAHPQTPQSSGDAVIDALFDRERVAFLRRRLQDDAERLVFTLSWELGFTPKEIAARHADIFPNTGAVYRVKERILRRLSEDPTVQAWNL
ncbi:MAG: sigma-70 family RNA polymerase sigma factor [Anaerolineae bacterium]|nr:sigma-70 family RNA polymerase sigma factor [Anaerolineae bacterium]